MMVDRSGLVSYGIVIMVFLASGGCAPSATSKPDTASAASPAAKGSTGDRTTAAPRSQTQESPAPSSLEALRRGETAATATSGPLKDVYFDFDSYDLRADARATLKANAEWLKNNPSARVEIEGHCDERGTNEYNLALGAKRAQAAKDYLATLGIPAERLSTISYGEEVPVCRDQTEDCWQKNRRARFVIIPGRPAS